MHLKSANPEVHSHHLVRSLTAPQGQPVCYLIHQEPPMVTESTDVVTASLGQGRGGGGMMHSSIEVSQRELKQ